MVHGLRKYKVELLHGKVVEAVPLQLAVANLLEFLTSFQKKCYIATHNLCFDGPRLMDAITSCSLYEEFSGIVVGLIDTLSVIRKVTMRKGKGECTLTGLARWSNIPNTDAHNAMQDDHARKSD